MQELIFESKKIKKTLPNRRHFSIAIAPTRAPLSELMHTKIENLPNIVLKKRELHPSSSIGVQYQLYGQSFVYLNLTTIRL